MNLIEEFANQYSKTIVDMVRQSLDAAVYSQEQINMICHHINGMLKTAYLQGASDQERIRKQLESKNSFTDKIH